ncbi:unnamed protein product (macronuclear) [Paramecium tetraurelia]|uniref:Importin N-terminal domain-containing protein n=1 Tax=Paramecium tetraurelia TaxID=5888 RepID=A0C556_PARTE|nr:uncharacterized protein GSPATT00006422001 [Paramecium tetraurelia]CAK65923.1 unnamed protein product [Paramecium tetraurelia]|eukprot:XP_001433320.1 hypothetical protein (macronuclear) [Paramecium tetraurelia strain d4-2]
MQTQDLGYLINALQLTYGTSQESVNNGEALLKQASLQPLYAISLLRIVDDQTQPELLRQSAVVNLKTFLEKHWADKKEPGHYIISVEEKTMIKATIIDALARCIQIKKLRSQYEDLIYKLVAIDFPNDWPQLVQQLVIKLQNFTSYEDLWSALLTLRRTCEVHQFLLENDRQPLEPIVASTFPILETLIQKFLEGYNEQSGQLVKVILKIFHHATHLVMPIYMRDYNVVARWMLYFKTIIQAPPPPELSTLTQDAEEETRREKTYIWTNKKWASRIILRFIQKFANKKMVESNMAEFAEHIKSTYAIGFMEIFYKILTDNTQFQGPRTCLFALKYLFYSLKLDNTKELLKPHYDKLIYHVAIPKMQLTPRDDQLWKSDPEEYIKRLDDFSLSTYNIKNPANDILQEVCLQKDINGNLMLISFLNYCQTAFSTNIDPLTNQPLDLLKKEALLWGIESLVHQISKISSIQGGLEQILEKFILQEFQNPVGFLRARACHVFNEYGSIEFKNKQNIQLAVQGISKCILDKELPVRVAAAIAFSSILQHKEAQDLIRPQLSQVLEIYIKLMELIDNEKIVRSLEEIVKNFTNEITPYAHQLSAHIATIFQKYCKKQNQGDGDSDDDGEAELAASGCLEAIKRILNAPLQQESYTQLESVIFPIINFALTETGCDFINEALEILNIMLYKRQQLTPGLWFYYPVLCYIILGIPQETNVYSIQGLSEDQYVLLEGCKKDWGSEFVSQILGSFRNYIQKGGATFLTQNDYFGNSFISLVFRFIQKIYAVADNGSDETDQNQVTTILIALIENYPGQVDNLIPQIIDFTLLNLQKDKKTNRFKIVNIGVLCMCIWYNPNLAVNYLNSKGLTDQILQTMLSMEKFYKYEQDINRLIFALCQLYSLPQIPNYLLQTSSEIGKLFVRLSTKILELREEEESCDQEDQAEEEEDLKKTIEKIQDLEQDDDEDDEDYDEGDDEYAELYDSPLEDYDAILLMEKLVLTLQQTNQQLYAALFSQLNQQEQEQMTKNIKDAKEQYDEWLKQKQQKNK